MKSTSPILSTLARLYSQCLAGRTGMGQRDLTFDFKDLLSDAGCEDGDARAMAISELRALDGKLLHLEGPKRDNDIIHRVRLPLANEAALYALLGEPSPTKQRQFLSKQFADAVNRRVPEIWKDRWKKYCEWLACEALNGRTIFPFSRNDLESNRELLDLVPKLLWWHLNREQSLLRFASCVLSGNSKRLGELAAEDPSGRRKGKLGLILNKLSDGELQSLEDVGILQTPRFALVHGPLRLVFEDRRVDLSPLNGPCRISETDIAIAHLQTDARRCITIENETSFHELAKVKSGELLICTSYPGAATISLLHKLPVSIEYWHFGDSDPEGFDILRDLRERTSRPFRAMHMNWRASDKPLQLTSHDRRLIERLLSDPKQSTEHGVLRTMLDQGTAGAYEQESLGVPTLNEWPYYGLTAATKCNAIG